MSQTTAPRSTVPTTAVPSPNLQAPGDDEVVTPPTGSAASAASEAKGPAKKQRRYKLFEDGGDYRLAIVSDGSDAEIPRGSLLPIAPSVCGGFISTAEAKKFVRNSGDLFANKQLMILRAIEILRCDVEVKPVVKVSFKPRRQISGPPAK